MNVIEFWGVNNPIRSMVQRYYEAPKLRNLSDKNNCSVLEVGCGQGEGAKIIQKLFTPSEYIGIDLDPKMIERSIKRTKRSNNLSFQEGDASNLTFNDNQFDLVIDFGIIHHIPNWRDSIKEIFRVIKPGGQFLFEELSSDTWNHKLGIPLKKILSHPYEEMFSVNEFISELESNDFRVEYKEKSTLGMKFFFGSAIKPS